MSKHFKFRSLMSIIYALIMLLPVTSVAFRCAYTIFNKNAFESYYGETINQIEYKNTINLIENEEYTLILNNTTTHSNYVPVYVEFLNGSSNLPNINDFFTSQQTQIKRFTIQADGNDYSTIFFYDNNGTRLNFWRFGNGTDYLDRVITINFKPIYNYTYEINNLSIKTYNNYSYLDNAFEYSLHEFIGNNGRGVLNLTDWFTSVFLQSSTHTQLYLDFINWYMNYTLLVSCVYILYLVLMWFVSLARRLLTNMIEKGGDLK